ncbi:hypothetical protein ACQPZP_05530 [Spirillospora sp. CA-142024]|uniref:hypothetical protein n=1 Tax=Spirillospora sp. CA-142024 TaxID=3240036 RepID=UPI003D930624
MTSQPPIDLDSTGIDTVMPEPTHHGAANALDVAEHAFKQLTSGPTPLTIDGGAIGHGLPARPIGLRELRTLLLDPSGCDGVKDAVWRELVQRARAGDPVWVVGCVGVAMPGLRNTAARVVRSTPSCHADDLVSELVAEFITQLTRIDIDRRRIAARLMAWARKGALRARGHQVRQEPRDPKQFPLRPAASGTDPADLLVKAARSQIITSAAAELIAATRLDGEEVSEIAQRRRVSANQLYKQRRVAEAKIVAAIREGRLSCTFECESNGG